MIRIQATCSKFAIDEVVTEGRAVKRLTQIRELFNSTDRRPRPKRRRRLSFYGYMDRTDDFLTVTTSKV